MDSSLVTKEQRVVKSSRSHGKSSAWRGARTVLGFPLVGLELVRSGAGDLGCGITEGYAYLVGLQLVDGALAEPSGHDGPMSLG